MGKLLVWLIPLMLGAALVFLGINHYTLWRNHQAEAEADRVARLQAAIFSYYAQYKYLPAPSAGVYDICEFADTAMFPDKECRRLEKEGKWKLVSCVPGSGNYSAGNSHNMCLVMDVPLRAACLMEVRLDDAGFSSGIGRLSHHEAHGVDFNDCASAPRTQVKYIYHIF